MGMIYDEQIFQKYRTLAITDEKDFIKGKTYWGNAKEEFIFSHISTDNSVGAKAIMSENGLACFCRDNNIGDSYNPWLIFDNKETCEACERELIITWDYDESEYNNFDNYDDYDIEEDDDD